MAENDTGSGSRGSAPTSRQAEGVLRVGLIRRQPLDAVSGMLFVY